MPHPQRPSHGHHEPSNPLKVVPPSHRTLLTTLHVLFPTLLLPALDLLDRRLVTRLSLVPRKEDEKRYQSEDDDDDESEHPLDGQGLEFGYGQKRDAIPLQQQDERTHQNACPPPLAEREEQDLEPLYSIFLVRSSQTTHPRRRKDVLIGGVVEAPAQKTYVVRLRAWNCACAAFAFAAFPGGQSQTFGTDARQAEIDVGMDVDDGAPETEGEYGWTFGGMSLDGASGGGGGVPCCKHLLACLLAERWQASLGSYVEERRIGRNEMAGIVADM